MARLPAASSAVTVTGIVPGGNVLPEVRALLQSLDQRTQDYVSYEYALLCAWLQLPELPELPGTERTALEKRRKHIESNVGP
ncbi:MULTISPECIES: hypothetical protein [Corallococcus]|uniref:hypothetical protein n=1 Tax=Corallococcus TaxID=83461 RepID=UPI0014942C00|nr:MULTISPECIES: hypothetical protein [Corallococcus]NPC72039.1 hypothetical protein [Corallococcus exiguus]NPD22360.1 hypothetical protein [Corallococcus exiguus]